MNSRPLVFLLMILGGIALAEPPPPSTPVELAPDGATLKGYDPLGGKGRAIYVVPIDGTIDLGLAPFVERVVDAVRTNDLIFLHMNTFGGRIDAAVRIRDALLDAKATTVVFVSGRAISAGALISLSCDTILMGPGATIGDAMPVEMGSGGEAKPTTEKAISYFRAEMAATAQAKGRPSDIAEAMVDPDVEIADLVKKGKLLTLTADEAIERGMADAMAKDFDGAVALLNVGSAERIEMNTHWAEKIARFLTDPIVSSLLMTIGFLGLLIDFYTQGFGIKGLIGAICLVLFFVGQYAAHLAGWEELILFGAGVTLLALEIFVIPGFGVAGVLGIVCVVAAVVMALVEVELPWDVAFDLGYLRDAAETALLRVVLMVLIGTAGTAFFAKYFPQSRLGKRIILGTATAAAEGYVSQSKSLVELVGKQGVTVGVLRPAGIAEIDGHRVDVVTEGDYIKKGSAVEVILVNGNRVVVKKIS